MTYEANVYPHPVNAGCFGSMGYEDGVPTPEARLIQLRRTSVQARIPIQEPGRALLKQDV